MKTFPILSIDAWGNKVEGYDWNMWHNVGEFTELVNGELPPDEKIIPVMIELGLLNDLALTECELEDDQHNIVIVDKASREPLFAIQYGHN